MEGWVIAASAIIALAAAFGLRTRAPAALSLGIVSVAGAALAVGGLLFLDDPSAAEWALAVIGMAILAPVHARIVLGPFRRSGA